MEILKMVFITVIIIMSLSVGYFKNDKKKRNIAIGLLGVAIAFYVAIFLA